MKNWILTSLTLLTLCSAAQAENTNINFLTLGASMNYFYEGDGDGPLGGDGRSYMMDLSTEYVSAHTNYLSWKSNNMDRLIGDWTNGTLSANDQQYTRIIQADYLYRAKQNRYGNVDPVHCEQYFADAETAGEAGMKKGYRGETLSTNDWEDLRVFRLLDDVDNIGTLDLPYKLDMTVHPTGTKIFEIGAPAPVFRLPKFETVLARTNYTDGARVDPPRAFYDRGTNRYANRFSGYTTNGAAPYDVKALEVAIPAGETTNDFVEIGGVRDKPMILIPCQLSDGYWWEFNAHDARPVYNAYKDVADFYFIHLQYHDTTASQREYFGTNAGKRICVMDMETPEELAAEAKNRWMDYPWFSIPTLLDVKGDRARNLFATQGGDSYYLIIDRNGRVAYDGQMQIWKSWQPNAKDFSGATAWANLMERELLKVLDNDGEYIPTNVTDWVEFEVGATEANRRTCLITDATVDSVDAVSNIVVISKLIGAVTNQYTLEIGPNTRLSNQEEISTLSTFAPGNTVTVKFWEDTYPSVTCSANYNYPSIPAENATGKRVVRHEVTADTGDGVIHHPRQLNEGTVNGSISRSMTWALGTLESISSTSRQITVSLNVDTNAMYGWNFWNNASNATSWGDAPDHMNTVSQWVESVQSGTNWTFVIDENVDIFINAENAAYSNLVEGGSVGLLYRIYQNGNQTDVYPEVLRLSLSGLPKIQTDVSSLHVSEGTTNGFNVHLSLQPEAAVTVTVSRLSGDTNLSVQSGASLTFTTNNWSTNQWVTLAATEDSDWTNGSAIFRCASPGSPDKDVTATESDNDTDPALNLPFEETFETSPTHMAGTLGDLDEQHGWTGGGTVQTGTVQSGSQALSLAEETASHAFLGEASNIVITLWADPIESETGPNSFNTNAAAVFYVNTNSHIVAYNATTAIELTGTTVSNGWNKFEIHCDYSSKVWNLSLNDAQVLTNFAFYGAPASFQTLELTEASRTGTSFFDSIDLTDQSGPSDQDGDGLPDSWETTYYGGATNANPTATASNGVNTVMEAYIADISPIDPDAAFVISNLSPLSSQSILEWTAASGRVYSVYWTSNLLNGFGIPMQTNYTGGVFTDATHSAEDKGFYKIDVELE